MRIEQLRYLDAIVSCGSMRRAGEQLHLSQPALSEAIRNLERELGVTLLERRRSGAKISAAGRELLPHLSEVLAAVERLRAAAGEHDLEQRTLRIGTVQAATVPIVAPAIRDLRRLHPDVRVEIRTAQQDAIRESLLDGSLDLGLVNLMAGELAPREPGGDVVALSSGPDDDLYQRELLRGSAVVCCRSDSPLAALTAVSVAELAAEPFVAMRPGYVMHRFTGRLFGAGPPAVQYAADGAEMGKTMVAEGLGVTVLPDYSIIGDPLERAGVITWRPLAGSGDTLDTEVVLVVQGRRSRTLPAAVRELELALHRRAATVTASRQPKLRPA